MENIKLSNFRKIKDTWDLDLSPISFFVGANNSGKSTVLKALLVIEDYINSDNHFELNFNGENARKHKIDCYHNAVNRFNNNKNIKDLCFKYTNRGYRIMLVFQPTEGKSNDKGKLIRIEVKREDGAKVKIYHTGGSNYQLEIDNSFTERQREFKDEERKSQDLSLINDIKKLIENDQKELSRLNEQLARLDDERKKLFENSLDAKEDLVELTDKVRDSVLSEAGKKRNNVLQKIISLSGKIEDSEKKLKIAKKRLENEQVKEQVVTYSPEFSLDDYHPSERSISRIIRRILPRYLRENDKSIRLEGFSSGSAQAFRISERIFTALNFSVDHLSPHRNNQTRLYINNNTTTDINRLIKGHSNSPIVKQSKAGKFLKKAMLDFDIGDDFRIKSIDGVASKIEILEEDNWINLVDKGFGAGQIFSILLKIALCIDNTKRNSKFRHSHLRRQLIVIEEPEANLHPALQSKLTDLFYEVFKEYDIRFILETHSEYSIRQSQIHIKELHNYDVIPDELPFAVYYFDKDKGPYKMEYRTDGIFKDEFGTGFFDVASQKAIQLLKRGR